MFCLCFMRTTKNWLLNAIARGNLIACCTFGVATKIANFICRVA